MEIVQNPQATLADLAAMLLSNLTTSASTCAALLSMKISVIADKSSSVPLYPTQSRSGTCAALVPYPAGDELEVDALPLLLDAFVRGANAELIVEKEKREQKGELHFLSSVFANLSTVRFPLLVEGHRLKNATFFIDVRWSHVLLDTAISGYFVAWRLLGVPFVETCRLHRTQGYYSSRRCYFDLEVRFAKARCTIPNVSSSSIQKLCVLQARTPGHPAPRFRICICPSFNRKGTRNRSIAIYIITPRWTRGI